MVRPDINSSFHPHHAYLFPLIYIRYSSKDGSEDGVKLLPVRLVKTDHQNVLKLPAKHILEQTLEHIIQKIEKIKSL